MLHDTRRDVAVINYIFKKEFRFYYLTEYGLIHLAQKNPFTTSLNYVQEDKTLNDHSTGGLGPPETL